MPSSTKVEIQSTVPKSTGTSIDNVGYRLVSFNTIVPPLIKKEQKSVPLIQPTYKTLTSMFNVKVLKSKKLPLKSSLSLARASYFQNLTPAFFGNVALFWIYEQDIRS